MRTLGISAFYHDSAAALIRDGELVAAAQEERFTRRKNDPSFPMHAIRSVLEIAGEREVDRVVYYERPLPKLERLLETWLATAPRGFRRFAAAWPTWTDRVFVERHLRRELGQLGLSAPVSVVGHHDSHAASAFLPSPFERAAILTVDGVGEWETATMGVGEGTTVRVQQALRFPHSLGLLYSAFTSYCGFRVDSGEYKVMGLAAFGEPRFADTIREHLIDLRPDGSFRLDLRYFDFLAGERMYSDAFCARFGGAAREPESPMSARFEDLAASIQAVTEDVVARMAAEAVRRAGCRDLCMAGGVALNCVANGKLVSEGVVDRLWVQPAAGDAGGALGAALVASPCRVDLGDGGLGACAGVDVDVPGIVDALVAGEVVGLVQGRMELGPRALGHRSILADPRDPAMQDRVNAAVKKRESFRPFAPAVLEERASEWFELAGASPYMTQVGAVKRPLPAVTHVDGTARVQTVGAENPVFRAILQGFEARTGCPVLLNTSFNVRGEPIVRTAEDAERCFRSTDIDVLAVPGRLVRKRPADRAAE
ncbi:MAG: carbamoyltransferase N-terminal domain-containing protein [Myxococcota bacterium]